jgi:hypothetical protein
MHYFDTNDWALVEFMHIQIWEAIVKGIQIARFIAISCDAVTVINIGLWICIHAYVI